MPKWVEANGGFFKTFKKIAFNEGGGKRATKDAIQKEYRRSGERVAQNLNEGESLKTELRNARNGINNINKIDGPTTNIEKETALRNLRADGKTLQNDKVTSDELDSAVSGVRRRIGRDSAIGTAKRYWSEPYQNLQSSDANTRALATAQLVGRTGMVAGGATLGIGMTHDLFANRENDTGLGGIVGNTIATTALGGAGAGIAAGVSLLKKL